MEPDFTPELEARLVARARQEGRSLAEILGELVEKYLGPSLSGGPGRTGADLVAAMQASLHKEIEIEPERWPMPVREPVFPEFTSANERKSLVQFFRDSPLVGLELRCDRDREF